MDPAPFALALAAGAVAALNPCGFVMLPAYLAIVVGDPASTGRAAAVRRAVGATAAMTVGFVAVFAAFAAVVVPASLAVERFLPAATIVIGVLLVAAGIWIATGHHLGLRLPGVAAAPGASARSMLGYGVAYAVASLSCTVGPFLAVTTSSARTGSLLTAAGVVATFALGMAAVVGALAVSAALARQGLTRRLRAVMPHVERAAGVLLVLAGLYVAYYGWYETRVFGGGETADPVVDRALAVQSWLSRTVVEDWPWVAAAALGVVAAATLLSRLRTRRGELTASAAGPSCEPRDSGHG